MTTLELERPILGRAKLLKQNTTTAHERLDTRIMAADPFADQARYAQFVRIQLEFHREIDALYATPALAQLLPDMTGRRRLPLIEQDLVDLGFEVPATDKAPVFGNDADIPTSLGWLYVAEGSSLGAAFLLKDAIKIGLSESFGARHLAGAPEGRGLHWRTFTAALDAVELSADEEARATAGANAAFTRVRGLVELFLPLQPK